MEKMKTNNIAKTYTWRKHAHWKTRERVRLLVITAIALGLVMLAIGSYVFMPAKADSAALEQAYAQSGVTITEESDHYAIIPDQLDAAEALTGLVFYPGGAVPAKAYLHHLATLSSETHLQIFVVKMPLNMAVFAANRALDVMAAHPNISTWLLGGHSLGGAMACRHLAKHQDLFAGLLLEASYCDVDIQTYPGQVLMILGGSDTVMDKVTIQANSTHLPVGRSTTETIGGMIHSQFGSYGEQTGDGVPKISDAGALESQIEVIKNWLLGI